MHVYVIGNATVDETIAVAEMPPAGASILGSQMHRDLGGKGANQAVVLARCGVPTTLVAAVGDDFRARTIREHLAGEPVTASLLTLADRASDLSIVLSTPDGENCNITTTDSAQNLASGEAEAALAGAKPGDMAVLQGNLSDAATRGLLEFARRRGMATAFNPSPLRPFFADLWPLADAVFLNRGEARALTGADGVEAARILLDKGVREVVLTLGADGAMLITGEAAVTVPAGTGPVIDTTGAGDTFMAVALASAALRGTRLDRRAIGDATRAAALTVGRRGTRCAFPDTKELAAILSVDRS